MSWMNQNLPASQRPCFGDLSPCRHSCTTATVHMYMQESCQHEHRILYGQHADMMKQQYIIYILQLILTASQL